MKPHKNLKLDGKLYKGKFTNTKGQLIDFTFPKSYIDNIDEKDFRKKMKDKYKCIIKANA